MDDADAVIATLGLREHPEGGWYAETWRADAPPGVRPAGAWQSARSLGAWTLVGCTVSPAFRFEGFELAPQGWEPGRSLIDTPDG